MAGALYKAGKALYYAPHTVAKGVYDLHKAAYDYGLGMRLIRDKEDPRYKEYYDKTRTIYSKFGVQPITSELYNLPAGLPAGLPEEETISASEKALRNIQAYQSRFSPINSRMNRHNTNASDPGSVQRSNRSNSIATVASDPGVVRSSIGSFSNAPNATRRHRKMSWEPVHPRGGKRRNKRTRKTLF